MRGSQLGRTSPSFLIAVVLAIVLVGGYTGWRFLRSSPLKESEMIVRQSRRALNDRVREFQNEMRAVMNDSAVPAEERLSEIEKEAAEAKEDLQAYVDDARNRLAQLDIPLRTHENRSGRLAEKLEVASSMIDNRVEEKREQLAGP